MFIEIRDGSEVILFSKCCVVKLVHWVFSNKTQLITFRLHFDSQFNTLIHVSYVKKRHVCHSVGRLMSVVSSFIANFIIIYESTRRHISDNRNLHTLKCPYW